LIRQLAMLTKSVNRPQSRSNIFTRAKSIFTLGAQDIEVGSKLGSGGFSDVRSMRKLPSNSREGSSKTLASNSSVDDHRSYAHKQLKGSLSKSVKLLAAGDLANEAMFLNTLSHPNIVSLHSTGVAPGSNEFFIVIEKVETTLDKKMIEWKILERNAIRGVQVKLKKEVKEAVLKRRLGVMLELVSAFRYLHENKILFRDIKPTNIGIDQYGSAKIFDFGLATELKEMYKIGPDQYLVSQNSGTRRYMAPEVFNANPYGLPADVYSFSVLLWEVVALEVPYKGMAGPQHARFAYVKKRRPKVERSWPVEMKALIASGWAHKAQDRPTMAEIEHTLRDYVHE
jgi:serine/threonine protein kinase